MVGTEAPPVRELDLPTSPYPYIAPHLQVPTNTNSRVHAGNLTAKGSAEGGQHEMRRDPRHPVPTYSGSNRRGP